MTKFLFHSGRCEQNLSNYEGFANTIGLTSLIIKEPKNDELKKGKVIVIFLWLFLLEKEKKNWKETGQ